MTINRTKITVKKCDTASCNNTLKFGLKLHRKYYSIKTSCGIAHICKECFNKKGGFESYPNALEHSLDTKKPKLSACPIYKDTTCTGANICANDDSQICNMPDGVQLIQTKKGDKNEL